MSSITRKGTATIIRETSNETELVYTINYTRTYTDEPENGVHEEYDYEIDRIELNGKEVQAIAGMTDDDIKDECAVWGVEVKLEEA